MTEKRFWIYCDDNIADNLTRQNYNAYDDYNAMQLCDLLNELSDENEQLKSFVEYEKRQHKHWKRECLENIEEIAQLKREIVQLKSDVESLEKENEQLKSRVEYLERKIQRERNATTKQHLKWSKEAEEQIQILAKENEQLKQENKELEKFRYNVFKRIGEIND